ncbi:hypothetical protein DZF91_09300 [Actinomadura logoneensis]|uniref:Uncharacterized protein n=1 Tax=Actinomadura logoneensis TaxID=2293572 RepID=A0A372JPH4_9ACTN|nr:hypothetical protein [Actinomadura logoneensis]RFU41923.1 hypothetical protein DZF91_09300 [Actinomadura logoneensis]
MSAVLLMGDLPSTGMLGAAAAVRLQPPPGPEGEAQFIDVVRDALAHRPAVLVVYPAWAPGRVERLVTLARAALMTDRVAGLPLRLPPLALSLVADQLAFVAPHVLPGALVSLAPALAESTVAGAWVNSVAHFEHLNVGLGKHVASYLPNGGFSVLMSPNALVHRVTSAQPVPEIEGRPADPVLLLTVPSSSGDTDWVHRSLSPALATASLIDAPAQPLSPKYWGAKKYVEFVAISGHPQALQSVLQSALQSARGVPCTWCGEQIALPRCPFCRNVQPSAQEGPPASPRPPADLSAQPPAQPQPSAQPRPQPPAQPPVLPQPPAAPPQGLSRQEPSPPVSPVQPPTPGWPSGPQTPPPAHPWQQDAGRPDPHLGVEEDEDAPVTRPEYRIVPPPELEAEVTRPEYRDPPAEVTRPEYRRPRADDPTPRPPSGPGAVHPSGPQPMHPSGPQPIRPSGLQPVQHSGPQPVQHSGPQPVQSPDPRAVHPADAWPRTHPSGPQPMHPSGPQPMQPPASLPVRPAPDVRPPAWEPPAAERADDLPEDDLPADDPPPEDDDAPEPGGRPGPPGRPRVAGEIVFPPRDRPVEHDDRSDTVVFGIPRVER